MTNHLDNQLTSINNKNIQQRCHDVSCRIPRQKWHGMIGKDMCDEFARLSSWVLIKCGNGSCLLPACHHVRLCPRTCNMSCCHLQWSCMSVYAFNWYVSVLMFCVYSEDVEIKDLHISPQTHHASKTLCFHNSCFCDYQKRLVHLIAKPTT